MTFYISHYPYRMARRWAATNEAATNEMETVRPLPVDIREEDNAYVLQAFVPGLQAEDLNIQILDDVLTIEGQFSQHEGEALMSELPAGAFRRSLRLPATLDAEKAEAKIENGVLILRLPQAESVRPKVIKVAAH
jgi:HSP20 family protein